MRKLPGVLSLILMLTGLPVRAQQPTRPKASPTRATADDTISGRVLNSTTGQALSEANVTLTDSNEGPLKLETTTDADGNFSFTHLSDSKYQLHAAHRGYIPAGFDEHEGYFTGIVTGEGMVTNSLKFLLSPQAIIHGNISDDAGDAVDKATVRLYRQDESTGREKIVLVNQASTDDLGNYEIPRVSPGNYFLVVSAVPWYQVRRPQGQRLPGAPSPLDVAFATTYYADTTDPDGATPIPVKAADRIPVNVTLHAQPAVSISLQFPSPQEGVALPVPALREKIFGQVQFVQQATFNTNDKGAGNSTTTIEFGGLAPGSYEMQMRNENSGPGGIATVDASSGSASVDLSQLTPQASVEGRIALEDGAALPAQMLVSLVPSEGQPENTRIDTDGSFHFAQIPAGDYRVVAVASNGLFAVKGLAASGAMIDGSLVKIGTTPVTLTAVMVESNASVRGFAKKNGKPSPGTMIVLVPADGNPVAYRRDQSDSDGSFMLRQALPGRYTVVAIEDGWSLEWARPEVMKHYLDHGLKVTLPLHAKTVALTDPVEVQPK